MRFFTAGLVFLILLVFTTVASTKIVFTSKRDGTKGIYIMDDDGSNVTLLTDKLNPTLPRWSPDGKQIVFERWVNPHDSDRQHLFLMNADGTNIRQLTEPHGGWDSHSSFSPDGKSIAFFKYERLPVPNPIPPGANIQGGKSSINVMNLESGKVKEIAEIGATFLDWSPDGKHIVCKNVSVFGQRGSNIWIMDVDGHDPHELLPPPPQGVARYAPRWSPDGKQILYEHIQTRFEVVDGKGQLISLAYHFYIYDMVKKTSRRLVGIPKNWKIGGADWMDDGKSIVFSAVEIKLNEPWDGNPYLYNIYKYNIRTGKRTRLTDHPGADYSLDWISDDLYEVSPKNKKPVLWGTLKAYLPVDRVTFQVFTNIIYLH